MQPFPLVIRLEPEFLELRAPAVVVRLGGSVAPGPPPVRYGRRRMQTLPGLGEEPVYDFDMTDEELAAVDELLELSAE
jgi:hypothetical protein